MWQPTYLVNDCMFLFSWIIIFFIWFSFFKYLLHSCMWMSAKEDDSWYLHLQLFFLFFFVNWKLTEIQLSESKIHRLRGMIFYTFFSFRISKQLKLIWALWVDQDHFCWDIFKFFIIIGCFLQYFMYSRISLLVIKIIGKDIRRKICFHYN